MGQYVYEPDHVPPRIEEVTAPPAFLLNPTWWPADQRVTGTEDANASVGRHWLQCWQLLRLALKAVASRGASSGTLQPPARGLIPEERSDTSMSKGTGLFNQEFRSSPA